MERLQKYEELLKQKASDTCLSPDCALLDVNTTDVTKQYLLDFQAWARGHNFSILRHFLKYADKHEFMNMVRHHFWDVARASC